MLNNYILIYGFKKFIGLIAILIPLFCLKTTKQLDGDRDLSHIAYNK